jgi:transcriptional regulator with XRE-family HTH domain
MRAAAKWVQPEHYPVVGAALAAARQRANITQVELAGRLGKPQSVVSQFEAGKRRLDLVEFLLIVRSLGADPVEIFAEIAESLPDRGLRSDAPLTLL